MGESDIRFACCVIGCADQVGVIDEGSREVR